MTKKNLKLLQIFITIRLFSFFKPGLQCFAQYFVFEVEQHQVSHLSYKA